MRASCWNRCTRSRRAGRSAQPPRSWPGSSAARPCRCRPDFFPSGFYRFARKSFPGRQQLRARAGDDQRRDGFTFLRGFEPRGPCAKRGCRPIPITANIAASSCAQEEGIMALGRASRCAVLLVQLPDAGNLVPVQPLGRLRLAHRAREGDRQPRDPHGLRASGQQHRARPRGRPHHRRGHPRPACRRSTCHLLRPEEPFR